MVIKAQLARGKGNMLKRAFGPVKHAVKREKRFAQQKEQSGEKYIVVADDLTPSETIQLNRSEILGFVTFCGSPNSHTAILARALGIPALIGTGNIPELCDGELAVIDADKGLLYIRPDKELLGRYEATIKLEAEKRERFDSLRGMPSTTKSGRNIRIYANIGGADEAAGRVSECTK